MTDFLVMTQPSMRVDLNNTVHAFGGNVHIWSVEEKPDIFDAAFARYSIFKFHDIDQYENIFYLDTDVLINGTLAQIFQREIPNGAICCLAEGSLQDDCFDCYGRSLFIEHGYQEHLSQPGFTSGAILFKNSSRIREIFESVLDLGIAAKVSGRIFPCFDQPFLNLLAITRESVNLDLLGTLMINNPKGEEGNFIINHFPGGPGNFCSKFSKMSRYLLVMIRRRLSDQVFSIVLDELFSPKGLSSSIVRLDSGIFLAELSDGSTGFLLSRSDSSMGLFLSIPSFEVVNVNVNESIRNMEVSPLMRVLD